MSVVVSPAASDTRARRWRLGTATLIGLLDSIGLGIIVPLLPFIAMRQGAAPLLVTLLVAVYALAGLVAGPVLGRLADRFGRRRVLAATLVGTALSYFGLALTAALPLLFAFRALGGAMAGREAVAQALVTDGLPPERHLHAIGVVGAARGVGLALGPVLGGLATVLFATPAAHFRATALISMALALAALLAVAMLQDGTRSVRGGLQGRPHWAHWRLPLVLTFAMSYAFGAIFSTTALYVSASFAWRETEAGILLGVSAGIVAAARLWLARALVARIGARRTLGSAFALATAGLVLIAALATPAGFVIGFAALSLGFGFGLMLTTVMVSAAAAGPERGLALGTNQSVGILALVVSAVVNGVAFTTISPAAPFGIAAAVAAAGGAVWLIRRFEPPTPNPERETIRE